jgi:hypothetical protein
MPMANGIPYCHSAEHPRFVRMPFVPAAQEQCFLDYFLFHASLPGLPVYFFNIYYPDTQSSHENVPRFTMHFFYDQYLK